MMSAVLLLVIGAVVTGLVQRSVLRRQRGKGLNLRHLLRQDDVDIQPATASDAQQGKNDFANFFG